MRELTKENKNDGRKKRKAQCLCNVWFPVNYVNTPNTRCLETRETLLYLLLFPLYSSLLPPPPFPISTLLPFFPPTASRRKGGGGGKVKIQRYYFSHAHMRPRMYMCVSHVHSMTVYQSKKGFLSSALNKGRSPLHRFPSSASISWLAHSPPSPPSCCINIHGYNVESG